MLSFEWFEGTQSLMFRHALFIREQVFVIEQGVDVALEIDGEDDQRWHIVAYADQQPVATARVYFPNDNGQLKIQRVAVKQSLRGQNIGLQLMQAIEEWALSQASKVLILSAQDQVIPFYEKLGFKVTNAEGYLDANIPHHDMEKQLTVESVNDTPQK